MAHLKEELHRQEQKQVQRGCGKMRVARKQSYVEALYEGLYMTER